MTESAVAAAEAGADSESAEAQPTSENPTLVQAEGLRKIYGPVRAVDDVSFEVSRGEILGFLGPNGAGKSTTLKILTGYLIPNAGKVKICGHDIRTETREARQQMGYLPEAIPLYPEMQVREYLRFIGKSRGLSGGKIRERMDVVVQQLGLERMTKRPTATLSKGYKQRVGLAQALIHDPEVLILDEPTNGLDPQQIIEMRSLISELSIDKAILFSTHILQEISAICTRIMVICDGRLIANGTPEELAQAAGEATWQVRARGADLEGAPLSKLGLGELVHIDRIGTDQWLQFGGAGTDPDLEKVQAGLSELGATVHEVKRVQRSLENVYLKLTREGRRY